MELTSQRETELLDLIKNSPIFAGMDYETCKDLLLKFEQISLAPAETLFAQDDPSDCLYLVAHGRLNASLLTADKKTRTVGTIEKGEIIGELGALSRQPRTLTIKAITHCKLLKLARDDFKAFCEKHASVSFNLIESIIKRSQTTIKLLIHKNIHKHIAIVPVNSTVDMTPFLSTIEKNISPAQNIMLINLDAPGVDTNESKINQLVSTAENEGKQIFFYCDPMKQPANNWLINYIKGIYIVAEGQKKPEYSEKLLQFLKQDKPSNIDNIDLVLLHPDTLEYPKNTSHWLRDNYFTLHHHLHRSDDKSYQRLLRFMTGKAIGLVLSGGGSKIWLHLGVIKALLEKDIPIDAIGGTSAGAVISACYAATKNYEAMVKSYMGLRDAVGNPFAFKNFTWPIISILSGTVITEEMEKLYGNIKIEDLWTKYFCVSSDLFTNKEVIHQSGRLFEGVRASVSLPGIIPPMAIDKQLLVDGALLNNLPVDVMRSLVGNTGTIIAASLAGKGQEIKSYNFPPKLPLKMATLIKLGIGKEKYNFPAFLETFFNALLLGSSAKERANELEANILINPDTSHYHPLHNTKKREEKDLINIGYRATMDVLSENGFI